MSAENGSEMRTTDSLRAGSTRRTTAILLGLAAVLALGVSLFVRSPDTEVAVPVEEPDEAPVKVEAPASTAGPTTTSNTGATSQEAPPETTSEYWLGEEAGLYAFVRDTTGLIRIDLDTGEQTVMNADLSPLVYTGEYLVATDKTQRLFAFSAEELSAPFDSEPAPISDLRYRPRSKISISSDRSLIWLSQVDYTTSSVEVSLRSGVETRHSSIPDPELHLRNNVSPRFFSPFAGGVYEATEDGGFAFYTDGFVVAEGFGQILIQQCDSALQCETTWFDTETLAPRPDLVAPDDSLFGGGVLFGNGRFVPEPTGDLLDIVTGERLALHPDEYSLLFGDGVLVLSDSPRFLASVQGGSASIRSFETSTRQEIPYLGALGASIVFVPKPPTEGASVG